MAHYICTGGCGGTSGGQKLCEDKSCSKFGESLEACSCKDGTHESQISVG